MFISCTIMKNTKHEKENYSSVYFGDNGYVHKVLTKLWL